MWELLLLVLLLLLVSALCVAIYNGLFHSIIVHADHFGPALVIYEEITGPYAKTMATMPRIMQSLSNETTGESRDNNNNLHVFNQSLSRADPVAIYYDDSKQTPQEDLRSIAGCVLSTREEDFPALLACTTESPHFTSRYPTFRARIFPRMAVAKSYFPLKGSLSLFFGLVFVYPRLQAFGLREGYGGPSMERYCMREKVICYMIPSDRDLDHFRPFDYPKKK